MGNNVTEIVFIIDKSGSMSGFEKDTIGGFNATIAKQKEPSGEAFVTTVLFSNGSETIHDRVPISEIKPMTEKDYCVGGCTALYDCIGQTVNHIANQHKLSKPDEVPEHTIFVITTDGLENASREYSQKKVKELISTYTEKCGWEFIFLAANIDAVEAAESIGISKERAAGYKQTKKGVDMQFCAMANAISFVRADKNLEEVDWKAALKDE